MTLFKAVEAAREAIWQMLDDGGFTDNDGNVRVPTHQFIGGGFCHAAGEQAANSLAALPDKPMTEDEIFKIIHQIIYHGFGSGVTTTKVIEALKAANVLYVKED